MKTILIVLLGTILSAISLSSFAHGGGTDRNGCHNDRTYGGYHCQ